MKPWKLLCSLAGLGVRRGDCVALMLSNRPEFNIADLAAVTVGATPFSIYVTYPAPEIEFLIRDSGARVAIVEQAFLEPMLEARGRAIRPGEELTYNYGCELNDEPPEPCHCGAQNCCGYILGPQYWDRLKETAPQ